MQFSFKTIKERTKYLNQIVLFGVNQFPSITLRGDSPAGEGCICATILLPFHASVKPR